MFGLPAGQFPRDYAAPGRDAVRITLVVASVFYLFRYGLDRPVTATYALFAAIALGGLSKIPGTGRQRARTVVRLLPVSWVLVAVGTYLSVRTWSAVAGMLVVGFLLAFSAVGGPRWAGAAPGLQLLYILPSFPPYDPGTLGARLAGTTAGLALLAASEALLFTGPDPPSYRERAAAAARRAARCATLLAAPPYTLGDAEIQAARETGQTLRSLNVPEAERPAGPGVRDRALSQTGLALRALLNRLTLLTGPPCGPPVPAVRDVLNAVAALATATASRLGSGPPPTTAYDALTGARARLATFTAAHPAPRPANSPANPPASTASGLPPAGAPESGTHLPSADASKSAPDSESAPDCESAPDFPPAVLREHAAVLDVADAALAMAMAADLAVGGRKRALGAATSRFWYATARPPALWWHRAYGHAGRRSVFFQNAVRLALALTAARLVAGVDTLPHGFWATLAALTLTRTTLDETRSTIRRALTGTLAGALVTAGLLALVGAHTVVYAAVLPAVMLIAFTVGPVKGVGWAQGMFTLLVALVFAQLAPTTWRLAEVRLLDVLVGSAIGAVIGLLAWPRGAHDELRRVTAELMRRAAEIVVATSASVAGGTTAAAPPAAPGHRSLHHELVLAESAYAQYQSEPAAFGGGRGRPARPAVDWQAALMAAHHTLWGSARLLEPPGTGLGPAAAGSLGALGDRVAGRMLQVSAALDPGGDTPAAPVPLIDPSLADFTAQPPGAPRRYYATASWLASLMTDLTRIAGTGHGGDGAPGPRDRR
ncbi:FUSC family protein [Streptomyces sp. NPDC004690]